MATPTGSIAQIFLDIIALAIMLVGVAGVCVGMFLWSRPAGIVTVSIIVIAVGLAIGFRDRIIEGANR